MLIKKLMFSFLNILFLIKFYIKTFEHGAQLASPINAIKNG